jgi:hypothetical protein
MYLCRLKAELKTEKMDKVLLGPPPAMSILQYTISPRQYGRSSITALGSKLTFGLFSNVSLFSFAYVIGIGIME